MQKKSLLPILFLLLINSVSAYYDYEKAFEELTQIVDIHTMILVFVFVLLFWVILKILNRLMGEKHKSGSGIISFVISFFLIWIINKVGIITNIEDLWDYFGYSEGILSTIAPIVMLIIIIILIIKIGYIFFLLSGLGIISMTILTDYIYQEGFAIGFGIFLILIGLYLWNRKRKIAKGIQQKGSGAGTIIKILILAGGIIFIFINPVIAGIILFLWLLIVLLIRKKKPKTSPGFWRRQGQMTKTAWKNREQRFRNWREQKEMQKQTREQQKAQRKANYKRAAENLKQKQAEKKEHEKIEEQKAKAREIAKKGADEKIIKEYEKKLKDKRMEETRKKVINAQNKITELEKKIPSVTIIERGKIEKEIRGLEKEIKKAKKKL